MKIKLLFILLSVIAFVLIFSVGASAEKYKINFDNKGTVETDENGVITLKDTSVFDLGTTTYKIKDENGNEIETTKQFLGWYTEDGRTFEPGETVTFTEDTRLYQASGVVVYNYADLNSMLGRGWWCVKLGADIVAEKNISTCNGPSGTMSILDLNGHNITTSSSQAFGAGRSGLMIVGEGTITHTGTGNFFATSYHSYNPDNIRVSVGQHATVISNAMLFYANDLSGTSGIPKVKIWGNVTAKGLLSIDKSTNAIIGIYEGANVTLTGSDPMIFRNETGVNTYARITLAGNITLTNQEALLLDDFVMTNKFEINTITSGSFTISSTDAERMTRFLPDTLMLKATENENGTTTYTVAEAVCVHEWKLNEELTVKPQYNITGLDVLDCSKCGATKQSITTYMPNEIEITITVRDENGDKQFTVKAGDALKFEISGIGAAAICCVTGLKDIGEFTANQIVAIEIPKGVSELTGFANESLEEITILDEASITVGALSPFKALKTLNINSATVIFRSVSSACTLETLSSNKEGAVITFTSECFKNVKALKNLNMCKGSTYKFGANSFNSSGLTQVILPDDSDIRFEGDAAFYGCPDLEYAYFGYNCISDKKIYKKPFDCCYSLKTVVLMDIIYVDQYTFCCNGNANSNESFKEGKGLNKGAINVYSHSDSISFHENVFVNREILGVNLYTVNAQITKVQNCIYTIYQGIGHGYTLGTIIPSTCVTQGTGGYVTDCPCQIDYRENEYTIYSTMDTSLNELVHQPFGTEEVALPLSEEHTDSDIVNNVIFKDGYMSLGTKSFKCLYCDVTVSEEENASFPALFAFLGYSTPVDGKLKLTVGYDVNLEAIGEYKDITGIDLDYGVVAAVYDKLEGKAPFDEALENTPVIKVEVNKSYASFEFVLTGFTEAQLDLALVMCAYVYDGAKYVYLQEVQNDIPASVTIGNYL